MPLQAVAAPAGQPEAAFTVAPGATPGGQTVVGLIVSNGIASAPTFEGFTCVGNPDYQWTGAAGTVTWYVFGCDGDLTPFYYVASGVGPANGGIYLGVATNILTPLSFAALLNGTSTTIGYGDSGSGLAPVTPAVDAFAVSVTRPEEANGAFTPPVPTLASVSPIEKCALSRTLNMEGGVFLPGDVVTVSYWLWQVTLKPPASQSTFPLLQDMTTPLSIKLPAFSNAGGSLQVATPTFGPATGKR